MEQAKRAGKALVDVPFDDVYVSDLSRAYDTAAAIVKQNDTFNDVRRMRVWKVLRERTFGVAEGKSIDEFNAAARKAGHSGDLWRYVPAKAESLEQLRERSSEFFDVSIKHFRRRK